MNYLLDTNICSAHMRRPGGLAHRLIQYGGRLATSTVVLGELYAGAHMLGPSERLLKAVTDLREDLQVLDFDEACAEQFGKLRGIIRGRGLTVGPLDLQIAATALVNDCILVTNNTKDFINIPNLQIEDWLTQ